MNVEEIFQGYLTKIEKEPRVHHIAVIKMRIREDKRLNPRDKACLINEVNFKLSYLNNGRSEEGRLTVKEP